MPPGLALIRHKVIEILALLGLASVLAACAVPPQMGQAGVLDFLQDGKTTKQEIARHLGTPGATYEDERILTYRLGHDNGGYYLLVDKTDWTGVCSNLVLALGDNGVLRRHSLVQVGACT